MAHFIYIKSVTIIECVRDEMNGGNIHQFVVSFVSWIVCITLMHPTQSEGIWVLKLPPNYFFRPIDNEITFLRHEN